MAEVDQEHQFIAKGCSILCKEGLAHHFRALGGGVLLDVNSIIAIWHY